MFIESWLLFIMFFAYGFTCFTTVHFYEKYKKEKKIRHRFEYYLNEEQKWTRMYRERDLQNMVSNLFKKDKEEE